LSSLGFEEHVSKTQKTTPDKKTRVSTRKGQHIKEYNKEYNKGKEASL
jgi:hypothetical protein